MKHFKALLVFLYFFLLAKVAFALLLVLAGPRIGYEGYQFERPRILSEVLGTLTGIFLGVFFGVRTVRRGKPWQPSLLRTAAFFGGLHFILQYVFSLAVWGMGLENVPESIYNATKFVLSILKFPVFVLPLLNRFNEALLFMINSLVWMLAAYSLIKLMERRRVGKSL